MDLASKTIRLIKDIYGDLLQSQREIIKQNFFNFFINDDKLLILNAHTRAGKDALLIAVGYVGMKLGYWDKVILTYPAYTQALLRAKEELEKIANVTKDKIVAIELRGRSHDGLCPQISKHKYLNIEKAEKKINYKKKGLLWIDYKYFSNLGDGCPYKCLTTLFNKVDNCFLITHHKALEETLNRGDIVLDNCLIILNEGHRVLRDMLPNACLVAKYKKTSSGWLNELALKTDILPIISQTGLDNRLIEATELLYKTTTLIEELGEELAGIPPEVRIIDEQFLGAVKTTIHKLPRNIERDLDNALKKAQQLVTDYIVEKGVNSLKKEIYELGVISEMKIKLYNLLWSVYHYKSIKVNKPIDEENVMEYWILTWPQISSRILDGNNKIVFATGSLTPNDVLALEVYFGGKDLKLISVKDKVYSNVHIITYEPGFKKIRLLKMLQKYRYQSLIITSSKDKAKELERDLANYNVDSTVVTNYHDWRNLTDSIPILYEGSELAENIKLEDRDIVFVDHYIVKDVNRYDTDIKEYSAIVPMYQIISRTIVPNEPKVIIMPKEAWLHLRDVVPGWRDEGTINIIDEVFNKMDGIIKYRKSKTEVIVKIRRINGKEIVTLDVPGENIKSLLKRLDGIIIGEFEFRVENKKLL